jgi:hypothetical protein
MSALVGHLKPGWFVARLLYLPVHLAAAVFAFHQDLIFLRGLGGGFVAFALMFAHQIARVAETSEPRFEVTESGIRCDFAAIWTLKQVDFDGVNEIVVLAFRQSISIVRGSGRVMVIPWRWVRLSGQSAVIEDVARWLGTRANAPVTVIRGPFEGIAKQRPLD